MFCAVAAQQAYGLRVHSRIYRYIQQLLAIFKYMIRVGLACDQFSYNFLS